MISVRGAGKSFPGGVVALDALHLDVSAGETVCLLGSSGCGKTTLLKAIMGLLPLDTGEIIIQGQRITGPGPDRAMVFQNFALLPWANVLANAAFGLELAGVGRKQREEAAAHWIRAVGLSGFERHYPGQLSGGMQQRVGLARALAMDPRILLMDEPFGALDAQTRRELQDDLLALLANRGTTMVFVTHSMEEAVLLGDRVALMTPRPGRIREVCTVPLPRPRTSDVEADPRFVELKEHLWRQLRSMRRSRADA